MPRPSAKNKLIEAAMATFLKNGFKGCTIEDIADRAGVFKGSFYNHFKSKESLAIDVIKRYLEEVVLPLLALEGPPSPVERLRAHFEAFSKAQRKKQFPGCMVANFSADISNLSPLLRTALDDAIDRWCAAIAKVIRQGQATGEIRKDLKADLLARFLANSMEGALVRARVLRSQEPFHDFPRRDFPFDPHFETVIPYSLDR